MCCGAAACQAECLAIPILHSCRPRVIDMADHPEGLALERHQAVLVVCSTQVRATLKGGVEIG